MLSYVLRLWWNAFRNRAPTIGAKRIFARGDSSQRGFACVLAPTRVRGRQRSLVRPRVRVSADPKQCLKHSGGAPQTKQCWHFCLFVFLRVLFLAPSRAASSSRPFPPSLRAPKQNLLLCPVRRVSVTRPRPASVGCRIGSLGLRPMPDLSPCAGRFVSAHRAHLTGPADLLSSRAVHSAFLKGSSRFVERASPRLGRRALIP